MSWNGTRTHWSWVTMRQRCNNPNAPKYRLYGGRGIVVCARWDTFENFLEDMGERPEGTTLDRIDNDGPYSPENCRWASVVQQRRNQGRTRLTEESVGWIRANRGVLPQKAMAETLGVSPSTVSLVAAGRIW